MEEGHKWVEGIFRNRTAGSNPSAVEFKRRIGQIGGFVHNSIIGKKSNCASLALLWRTAIGAERGWLRLWATIVASRSSDCCD